MFEQYLYSQAPAWEKIGFQINWRAECEDIGPDYEGFAVTDWHGEVFINQEEENKWGDPTPIQIGRVHFSLINAERVSDWHEVLEFTERTAYFKELYRPIEPIRALRNRLEGYAIYDRPNVLMLHSLEILPQFRKKGFGFAVLTQMLNRFQPGTGYAVLCAAPMDKSSRWKPASDFDREMKPRIADDYDAIAKQAGKRLRTHYAKVGFQRIARTDFMALPLGEPY